MKHEIIFESERINFIKLTEDLAQEYLDMVNDIEVQKYIGHNRITFDLEREIKWIRYKLENNSIIFSMIEKESNEFIGNIEIMRIKNNIGEMGIAITRKKQDKHFGQEAIKRLIEYATTNLKLDGLELNVFDFNPRGISCYKKVGFVTDGLGKTDEEIHMVYKK